MKTIRVRASHLIPFATFIAGIALCLSFYSLLKTQQITQIMRDQTAIDRTLIEFALRTAPKCEIVTPTKGKTKHVTYQEGQR